MRLPGWDYKSGSYFVTICTKNMRCWLGEVVGGEMRLNEFGEIVRQEILKTPKIRPNVKLVDWVIMPNHVHFILFIDKVETSRRDVSTRTLKPNTLGSIVNQIKMICTKRIHKINSNLKWQFGYFEKIIKSKSMYEMVKKYVQENPMNWKRDRKNPKNIKKQKEKTRKK